MGEGDWEDVHWKPMHPSWKLSLIVQNKASCCNY
jgi:hypothetical protein